MPDVRPYRLREKHVANMCGSSGRIRAVRKQATAGASLGTSDPGECRVEVADERSLQLASIIEGDVIPRLLMLHRNEAAQPAAAPANRSASVPADTGTKPRRDGLQRGRAEASRPATSLAGQAGQGVGPTPPRRQPRITARQIDELRELIQEDAFESSVRYCRALNERGYGLDLIFQGLLAPVARQLGDMWKNDEADFVEVTLSVARLQRLLFTLRRPHEQANLDIHSALLTVLPGEQHTLGLHIAAEHLMQAGLHVETLVATELAEIEAAVKQYRYDIVGFSIGSESLIPALAQAIDAARSASRHPGVKIMVGGPWAAVAGQGLDPAVARTDCIARDLAEALCFIMKCRDGVV